MFKLFKKKEKEETTTELVEVKNEIIVSQLAIEEIQEANLIEVTNPKMISKIDQMLPQIMNVGTAAAKIAKHAAKGTEMIYSVKMPSGAKLMKSAVTDGAFRGAIVDNANKIKGQVELVPIKGSKSMMLQNAGSAAMNIGSMVVGQYYMSQIDNKLTSINDNLSLILEDHESEFKSKLKRIISRVQEVSRNIDLIVGDSNLDETFRNNLFINEDTCIDLLGEVNDKINSICAKPNETFTDYSKDTNRLNNYLSYQMVLTNVLKEIANLKYAMFRGAYPLEECFMQYNNYMTDINKSIDSVLAFHSGLTKKYGIDLDNNSRKAKGIKLQIQQMIFGSIQVDEVMINNITKQKSMNKLESEKLIAYHDEDVELINKDGKLYYLKK